MNALNIQSKFKAVLLGTFAGDAFGLPFEFSGRTDGDIVIQRASEKGYWGYSDDTEMMIGISEALIKNRDFDPELTLNILAENYEPARGYGKSIKLVFRHMKQGGKWEDAAYTAWEDGSEGNGAASRIAPVACIYHSDNENLEIKLKLSARITHAHANGITGAFIQGLAIAYLIQLPGADFFEEYEFLSYLLNHPSVEHTVFAEKLDYIEKAVRNSCPDEEAISFLGNGVLAKDSVPAGLYFFLKNCRNFEKAICNAACNGGDTDTICAMVGALSGALNGMEAIPESWLFNLEKGGKGIAYVSQLSDNLFNIWHNNKK
ncbi:MAG: hypothetical protein GY749_43335 [Desulfobacteraceae bacterium]|nr:hypothetical protein [Desulfobacteraceae bacterium]